MYIEDFIKTEEALDVLEHYADWHTNQEPTMEEQLLLDWGFLEQRTERVGLSKLGREFLIKRKPSITEEIVDDVIERIYWGKYQDYVIDYLELDTKFIFRIEDPDGEVSKLIINKDVTLQTLKTRMYSTLRRMMDGPRFLDVTPTSGSEWDIAKKRAEEFLNSVKDELAWSKYIENFGLVSITNDGYIVCGPMKYCAYSPTHSPRPDLVTSLLYYLNFDEDVIKGIITQHRLAQEARARENQIKLLLEKRSMDEIRKMLKR